MPGNHLTAHALSTRGLCMILVKRDVSYRTKWPLPTEALCLFPTVFMPVCHSSPCPQFSQERSAVIYLHYHQSNREEKIMTVPTMTTNKPTWPSLSCTAQGTPLLPCNSHRRSAPPPRSGTAPRACARPGSVFRAGEAASRLEPLALSSPGAWCSPARPGPPSRWERGEPESGRAWGRELRRGRPGALRPCRGQAGAGGG